MLLSCHPLADSTCLFTAASRSAGEYRPFGLKLALQELPLRSKVAPPTCSGHHTSSSGDESHSQQLCASGHLLTWKPQATPLARWERAEWRRSREQWENSEEQWFRVEVSSVKSRIQSGVSSTVSGAVEESDLEKWVGADVKEKRAFRVEELHRSRAVEQWGEVSIQSGSEQYNKQSSVGEVGI